MSHITFRGDACTSGRESDGPAPSSRQHSGSLAATVIISCGKGGLMAKMCVQDGPLAQ